jgi:hypothetical protein
MRAVGGAFLVVACCLGVAGVVFLARAARPVLRSHWVTEVRELDESRELPTVPARHTTDIRRAGASFALAVLALLFAIFIQTA